MANELDPLRALQPKEKKWLERGFINGDFPKNYRESFEVIYEDDREWLEHRDAGPMVRDRYLKARVKKMLEMEHIIKCREKLKGGLGLKDVDQTILEQGVLDQDARFLSLAANRAEKMSRKDDVEYFWDLSSELGAEVHVPLPERCPHCDGSLEAVFGIEEFFASND